MKYLIASDIHGSAYWAERKAACDTATARRRSPQWKIGTLSRRKVSPSTSVSPLKLGDRLFQTPCTPADRRGMKRAEASLTP